MDFNYLKMNFTIYCSAPLADPLFYQRFGFIAFLILLVAGVFQIHNLSGFSLPFPCNISLVNPKNQP
jgi:hypothetical protein